MVTYGTVVTTTCNRGLSRYDYYYYYYYCHYHYHYHYCYHYYYYCCCCCCCYYHHHYYYYDYYCTVVTATCNRGFILHDLQLTQSLECVDENASVAWNNVIQDCQRN